MKTPHRAKVLKLRDIMTTPVLKLSPSEPASDALALMRDERVRHAPVVEGTAILGIVSERDLGGPHGGLARKSRTVRDLMRTDPVLGAPDMSVTDAVVLVRERRVGCLPVVDAGRLLGIVTRSDLLAALAHLRRGQSPAASRGAADIPRPPLLVSPNRDKWP
jgi:acetoin utilization protein AcuB